MSPDVPVFKFLGHRACRRCEGRCVDRHRWRISGLRAASGATGHGVRRAPPSMRTLAHRAKQSQSQSGTPTDEVQWKCQTDDGEVAYVAEINALLEEAFCNGRQPSVSFTGHGGFSYLVNIDERTQVNRTTGTRRAIFRYVNGNPSGWVTKLDPRSRQLYFVDRFDSKSGSTWDRNELCPSVPFQSDKSGFILNPL